MKSLFRSKFLFYLLLTIASCQLPIIPSHSENPARIEVPVFVVLNIAKLIICEYRFSDLKIRNRLMMVHEDPEIGLGLLNQNIQFHGER